MLQTGIKAPAFSLPDQNGEIRTLDEFHGKKVLLYFYSKDNTCGCTKQAVAYSEFVDKFAAEDTVIIGISKDTSESHKKFEDKHGLKIILLADPDKTTLAMYDVLKEKKQKDKITIATVRTTYLIDEEGTIVFANNKVKAADDAANMLEQI